MSLYKTGLDKNDANYTSLTPLTFLRRAAHVYPKRTAVIYGSGAAAKHYSWSQFYSRSRQLASALSQCGVGKDDTVAVMLPNTPPMLEAHFGIPMMGAVINAINIRLDAATVAYILDHGEAKALIVDTEFSGVIKQALKLRTRTNEIVIIDVADDLHSNTHSTIGSAEYEVFLEGGDPTFEWQVPSDEWDAIALNYTSGTTGRPKGVVYHHRGAAIASLSTISEWDLAKHPVYLWTLPMFHCNGWCFPWTIAARAGTHVCLRKVGTESIFAAMREHAVSHYCAAPIVHNMLIYAPDALKRGVPSGVKALVGGAPPPAAMIGGLQRMGFELMHVYGLTEVYGPAGVRVQDEGWSGLSLEEQASLNSRQGLAHSLMDDMSVRDPATMAEVPSDGCTVGEVMFRGNMTMKGYLKEPQATGDALKGGWFRTGDLAVIDPDGYVKIVDRDKDIIISGGENISSIEVENALYYHDAVAGAAVVAQKDEQWGETPCAFVELKPGANAEPNELIEHCRQHLAGFKVPKTVFIGELPTTSTGKIQKFILRERVQ